MAKDNYPQTPTIDFSNKLTENDAEKTIVTPNGTFPNDVEKERLDDYTYYERLFLGKHFDAFRIEIDDERYNRAFAKLRYLAINFAGLLSKITADMLFSEPPTIKVPDGDQAWVDAFWRVNNMDVQCYESALSNSYMGDAVFKLRSGKRFESESAMSVICEDFTPRIYFPDVSTFNVRAYPKFTDLKWSFKMGNEKYLRVEKHEAQKITNQVFLMKENKTIGQVNLSIVGLDIKENQDTGVDFQLVTHVPNWKTGNRYFGLSDYHDLDYLFYALNNRMTKIDNILDKHGDPILTVPTGILDDKGNVNKKALGVIEVSEGENNKPEYIVWDASLQSAFTEVEKIVDFLYLTAEISPDLLGLGEGVTDSGKALKFKLMRTLAKTARKRLYYDMAIKELIYNAQVFAKANSLMVDGKLLKSEPVRPEIDWQDGLPIDNGELQTDLIAGIDAGIKSKKQAIIILDGVDEKTAEKTLDEIEAEKPKIELPKMNLGNTGNAIKPAVPPAKVVK